MCTFSLRHIRHVIICWFWICSTVCRGRSQNETNLYLGGIDTFLDITLASSSQEFRLIPLMELPIPYAILFNNGEWNTRGVLERVPEKKSGLNYSRKTSRIWVMNERTDVLPAALTYWMLQRRQTFRVINTRRTKEGFECINAIRLLRGNVWMRFVMTCRYFRGYFYVDY